MTKRELDNASTTSLAQALEIEALAQSVNVHTDDLREALTRTWNAARRSSRAGSAVRCDDEDRDELRRLGRGPRRARASGARASRAMGGEERLAKHRGAGKLDVRARIDHLLDPGSFQELGTLVGGEEAPADAVVMGSGRIDGRPVMVAAEDFTVKAGTISEAANSKRYRVAELAVTDRVPLVMMLEGAGFRADGQRHAPHADRHARPGAVLRAGCRSSPRCSARRPATARWSRRCRTSR